jgi:hypothetical protein
MTPQEFIAKWGPGGPAHALNEEQGAQSHFLDLCELLGVPKPGTAPDYRFEEKGTVIGGHKGYADVFKRGHFAWENKAPGRNLDAALKQLLTYSLALANPPLLVVCDRLNVRIHTQFNGHPSETYVIRLDQFDQPEKLALLRRLWIDPESFRPHRTTRDITEAAARSFATLAEQLRKRGNNPEEVAHFLTQCLFCFFAEDVGLLPGRMFERLVNNKQLTTDLLTDGLADLFAKMRDGGLYGPDHIPWFNGGLFRTIAVPKLQILDVTELRNAAGLNWSAIDVSIFGTLFERGLDPSKRSQLGAHYTDPATIMRLIEPVVVRPLFAYWEQTRSELAALMAKSVRRYDKYHKAAHATFVAWLQKLGGWRVLDPACGSGNFLFLTLKAIKDVEHKSHLDAAALGLDRQQDLVTGPENVLGIELNEYAAELARVTIWIGELQWRIEHGYAFKTNPILEPLDHIECRDALMKVAPTNGGAQPTYVEADWPHASVVIGNPPFLGVSRKRRELGETYTRALDAVFAGRVPGGADLVCYWFDKALKAIEQHGLGAAGLVATNSIRGGANRKVLHAIVARSRVFEAWSDEPWVNDGAAVRVSLICFGHGPGARLNGDDVPQIYADLTAPTLVGDSLNLSMARPLASNMGASFQGASKKAKFEIDADLARSWLRLPNPHGRPNSDVLKPWANGFELSRGPQNQWIIDFGTELSEHEASLYEQPFAYVQANVKHERLKNNREAYRKYWWRFAEARPGLRSALKGLSRYIATIAHSKHRFFVWLPVTTSPDQALITFAREDDMTLGLLHSRFHELWSLRLGTSLEDRPRYTPTSCFETFPFPEDLTPQDTADQLIEVLPEGFSIPRFAGGRPVRTAAIEIARAAKKLTELRDGWLNPSEWTERVPETVPLGMSESPYPHRVIPKHGYEKQMAARTLTNLYNVRPAWLDAAHKELDRAVAAAYGWADYTPEMSDEIILQRLLTLNLERSERQGGDSTINLASAPLTSHNPRPQA